jgi:hypothetical protein
MPNGSTWKLIGSMVADTSAVWCNGEDFRTGLTIGVDKGIGGSNLIIFTRKLVQMMLRRFRCGDKLK